MSVLLCAATSNFVGELLRSRRVRGPSAVHRQCDPGDRGGGVAGENSHDKPANDATLLAQPEWLRAVLEMPFGFRNDTPPLSWFWCSYGGHSGSLSGTRQGSTIMEMHQVRYFLAVTRLLNFTRAADECNVTQPSLTRAIKQLEAELGGDLFRRERPAAQLTELGQRMLPLLQQCYDAASGARMLASSFKSGEIGALRIALSHSVDLSVLIPHLEQIKRQFNRLEFRFLRGTSHEVGEYLKKGEAELGIAAELGTEWDRLDIWPLFTEEFYLLVNRQHPLANRRTIGFDDLRSEQWLSRSYCEHSDRLGRSLREHGLAVDCSHEISSERDLIELLEADIGVAVAPSTATIPDTLKRISVEGLDARRTVHLYGVAGRQRTAVASAVMRMLRGADWPQFLGSRTGA
jgi:DNA-binding transcriptional LysR family regulator